MANTLVFYADYTASGVGVAPSPAPTVAVYKVDRSTGTESVEVAAGAAMTASSLTGRYFYRLAGADLQTYDYHARATTSDASVDRRDQPSLWVRWSDAVATDASGAVTAGTVSDKTGYALTAGERDAVADALLDLADGVESGETPRQFLRKLRAVAFGLSDGAGAFKRKDGTTTSLTVTLDGAGSRTAVTDGTN